MATINKKSGKKWWSQKPEPKTSINGWTEGSSFYNTPVWRNARKSYMDNHPLCEISLFERKHHAGKVCEHIIPISMGGSMLDERNLMSVTEFYARRKTGLEKHAMRPLIECFDGGYGLIPRRREDLYPILIRKR